MIKILVERCSGCPFCHWVDPVKVDLDTDQVAEKLGVDPSYVVEWELAMAEE